MGDRSIVAYKAYADQHEMLDEMVAYHLAVLLRLGYLTDAPVFVRWLDDDNLLVSFQWKDGARRRALVHPDVRNIRLAIGEIAEAKRLSHMPMSFARQSNASAVA
ncbi:hypothetical protein HCZ30_08460 [Marivivens donghaensis]|uniref:DUF2470 domain-containing protein n=1 Tax=Marivivens donghaensis TaxID=1699413 RepID=A0ABX0VZ64_9RHOB|nr:hypothetical protein [Marivivens donghaensis]NIY72467.1 hypothetical protein [Marivivens donghaensis]